MIRIITVFAILFNFSNSQRLSVSNNGIDIGDIGKLLSTVTSNVRTPSAINVPGVVSVNYAPNSRSPQSIRTPNTAVDYDANGNIVNTNVVSPFGAGFPFGGGFPFNVLNSAYQTVLPSVLGQVYQQFPNPVSQPYQTGGFQQFPSNIVTNQQVPVNNYQPVNNARIYQPAPVNNAGFQTIPNNNFIRPVPKPAPPPQKRPTFEYPGITNSLNKANAMLKTIGVPASGGLNFPFRGFYG